MIDIYDALALAIENSTGVSVMEESYAAPAELPAITIKETNNTTANLDSDKTEKYANITYRITVSSDSKEGRRKEATELFNKVDGFMVSFNFSRVSKTINSTMYNSTVYQIVAVYEATVDANGAIYRR